MSHTHVIRTEEMRNVADRKRSIPLPDGRVVEGIEVGMQSGGEHWNEYFLDDGTVVRIKLVATEALRIEDEFDPSGQPLYFVGSTNVMVVSAPENLKRKEGQ